jgi:hypothetical protein
MLFAFIRVISGQLNFYGSNNTIAISSSWVGLDLGPAANGQSSALIRLHHGVALRQSATLLMNML